MDISNILFLDTESNPDTKQPECITWLRGHEQGIIGIFDSTSYLLLKELWDTSEAVLFFNAPYDLGVLSILYNNNYEWVTKSIKGEKSSSWKMELFKNNYEVRRISGFRNMIRVFNRTKKKTGKRNVNGTKSTPIIDLLKLWSILVYDKDVSLKSLIKKELHCHVIPWSEESARTDAYRYQDVVKLRELFQIFLNKISDMEDLKDFTSMDWCFIKTPATFTKIMYEKEYPDLRQWQKSNNEVIEGYNLKTPLEVAYNGGVTLSMYRGFINNIVWLDIKGAYAKAIEILNTDSYLRFNIEPSKEYNFKKPYLLRIKTNFVLTSMNKSLKLFYTKALTETWIWNYDIVACKNLIDDYYYEVLECYKIIPLTGVKQSIPVKWQLYKNREKSLHGKTTRYQFFKYLGNTSYGIKAQRKPFTTIHTNMVIAGIITSMVHMILCRIIKIGRRFGLGWLYSDTDSCAFVFKGLFDIKIIDEINKGIAPFEVESEGIFTDNYFLSLKRYMSLKGDKHDKIKIHGKGRYSINLDDIKDYILTKTIKKDYNLSYNQLAGNTARSIKMILNLYPNLYEYCHPFMFVKNIRTKVLKSEFFNNWYYHIDTKTTYSLKDENFNRAFHVFDNLYKAQIYFHNRVEKDELSDNTDGNFRNWDDELEKDF